MNYVPEKASLSLTKLSLLPKKVLMTSWIFNESFVFSCTNMSVIFFRRKFLSFDWKDDKRNVCPFLGLKLLFLMWFYSLRLKDGNGEKLYPRSSFVINCTGR